MPADALPNRAELLCRMSRTGLHPMPMTVYHSSVAFPLPRPKRTGCVAAARTTSTDGVRFRRSLIPMLVVPLVVGLVLGGNGRVRRCAAAEDDAASVSARALSKAFRKSAKAVIPSVVKITTTADPAGNGRHRRFPNPFGGDRFAVPPDDGSDDSDDGPPMPGLGSGVIIDAGGAILTNEHVVNGADQILVELADGRQFKAVDVKIDEQSDLAIVRIKADGPLPAAKLGDSDALDIGDWVLAIGNPFDLDLTVSAGIISSKGRVLPSSRRAHFLQTDAAINPGNSGGPLVNLDGEVVGINTAIASASGVYEGVGFAIPSNLARWVADELMTHGRVRRAYLGVAIAELDARTARRLGSDVRQGVLISDVFPNSPAAKAQLRAGDIITAFAGRNVTQPRELQELVERAAIDSTQTIRILRDGRPRELSITVEALPEGFDRPSRRRTNDLAPEQTEPEADWWCESLQIEVSESFPDPLEQAEDTGVTITRVAPDGAAAEVGLRPGMRILRVGTDSINSIDDLRSALRSAAKRSGHPDEGVLLMVHTGDGVRFVCPRLP